MKRYNKEQIEPILSRFMHGQTTLEEEALLAEYFRTAEVSKAWEAYKEMFAWFDSGMEEQLDGQRVRPLQPARRVLLRRWWVAIAAAVVAAAIFVPLALKPDSEGKPLAQAEKNEQGAVPVKPIATTQQPVIHATTLQPVETTTRKPTTAKRQRQAAHPAPAAQPAPIATDDEAAADIDQKIEQQIAQTEQMLRRAAFINAMEAEGFRAVHLEDGSIDLQNDNSETIAQL